MVGEQFTLMTFSFPAVQEWAYLLKRNLRCGI